MPRLRRRRLAGAAERTLREAVARDYWDTWERIACPALVVRGEAGTLPPDVAREMTERLPGSRCVTLAGAGHDLHLDRPEEWRDALNAFLADASATVNSEIAPANSENPCK